METIWFIIWGVLWGVYFMLDGFDLGAGVLMKFIAKDETDRKKVLRTNLHFIFALLVFNCICPFRLGEFSYLMRICR